MQNIDEKPGKERGGLGSSRHVLSKVSKVSKLIKVKT
jgi:hypothetical protein